jgi:hypothetical protein
MQLGQLMVEVGKMLARHCDKYVTLAHPELPPGFMLASIEKSINAKGRLLHYFPMKENDIKIAPDGSNMDSW